MIDDDFITGAILGSVIAEESEGSIPSSLTLKNIEKTIKQCKESTFKNNVCPKCGSNYLLVHNLGIKNHLTTSKHVSCMECTYSKW